MNYTRIEDDICFSLRAQTGEEKDFLNEFANGAVAEFDGVELKFWPAADEEEEVEPEDEVSEPEEKVESPEQPTAPGKAKRRS